MATVAINGLGRIGRAALKILLDADGLDLVAVNDIADVDNLAYLLKYDTVYGRYPARSLPLRARWSSTAEGSRRSPSVTRRTCRGTTSASTSSWNARASSPPSETWRGMSRPARRT
jgi:Glyceraldehyde 3-phosphate dehydrogenase, NAD binding domain